jgi:nitrite reductase (NO-forming)
MMKRGLLYLSILILIVLMVTARNAGSAATDPAARPATPSEPVAAQEYALQTAMRDGRMVFVGIGGEIDGVVNPDLVARVGTRVRVTLLNGDGMPHDLSIAELGIKTPLISAKGSATGVSFSVTEGQEGTYDYFCTVSGHRQAGMAGKFVVR